MFLSRECESIGSISWLNRTKPSIINHGCTDAHYHLREWAKCNCASHRNTLTELIISAVSQRILNREVVHLR